MTDFKIVAQGWATGLAGAATLKTSAELDWLEEARTWAHFLALLAKESGGHLTRTACVQLAKTLNESEPPARLRAAGPDGAERMK